MTIASYICWSDSQSSARRRQCCMETVQLHFSTLVVGCQCWSAWYWHLYGICSKVYGPIGGKKLGQGPAVLKSPCLIHFTNRTWCVRAVQHLLRLMHIAKQQWPRNCATVLFLVGTSGTKNVHVTSCGPEWDFICDFPCEFGPITVYDMMHFP